jgi:hypothetical protein
MNVKQRQSIEKQIARKIIKDALAAGYRVSVHDGEDYAVVRSKKGAEIFAALCTTDDDRLFFSTEHEGRRAGWVWLVYGNDGYDVICDYTATPEIERLLAGGLALAEKLEEKYG